MSCSPFVSPETRLSAADAKATKTPSDQMQELREGPLASVPSEATDTLWISPPDRALADRTDPTSNNRASNTAFHFILFLNINQFLFI
jgi:hypothetical protein